MSFDVVSLFTNIPIGLALSVVEKRLDEVDVSDYTPLPLLSLLRLCLSSTTFCYNGTIYQQIFGTAMGSPVSVVVANVVMEHIEDLALRSSLVPTVFWKRYVDDVLSAVPANQVDEMLAHINSIDHNIHSLHLREKLNMLYHSWMLKSCVMLMALSLPRCTESPPTQINTSNSLYTTHGP